MTLARTPLFEEIQAQNARFTDFAGWEMPVQFTGLKQEHEAVRTQVGLFDISHMGKFTFKGKQVLEYLQTLVPSNLKRLQPGQAQYTVLLNAQGGIIDDLIIYYQGEEKTGEQHGVIIVNAATRSRDKAWFLANLEDAPVDLRDVSRDRVLLALQGPQAAVTLQPYLEADLSGLLAFEHITTPLMGEPAFISRTGYTGEDGFEIMVSPEVGKQLWRSFLESGVTPCGLGARNTLRLEAALALYGQDLDNTTSPIEAGLSWLVHLDEKGTFMGREVIETQKSKGISRKLVGITMEGRHIARHGYPVLYEGEKVGEITSGTKSPTLGTAIALAYVSKPLAKVGQTLEVEIRGKAHPATVVKKPFYRSPQGAPKS
ncbi:glycine cleavage system aminomethyltransferase GcvT [Spirulina sp. CS-785/01]|nr:glycine cleavage system aminomethyltransferase GcvT [Spirulina sp. CS-785/01]MDB9311568.1 glycine cleavage system aminomethyltransferase GcvT [Spirulina sp. CS-785/01]